MKKMEMEAHLCIILSKLCIGFIIGYEVGSFLHLSCCFTIWTFES